jgi:hypothetical protein
VRLDAFGVRASAIVTMNLTALDFIPALRAGAPAFGLGVRVNHDDD